MIYCFSCQNDFFLLKLYFRYKLTFYASDIRVANVQFFSSILSFWNIFKFDVEFFRFFSYPFNDVDGQTKGPSDDSHCSVIVEWDNLAFEFLSTWAVYLAIAKYQSRSCSSRWSVSC